MAAAAVRWFLRETGEHGTLPELVSTGEKSWRFGAARPVRVMQVSKSEPMVPSGRVLATREQSVPDTVPSVVGQRPWWVVAEIWWRAPDTTVDYPGLHEGLFGRSYQLNGADWVLDRAVIPAGSTDPGDETWAHAETTAAAGAAGKVLATTGLGLAAILAGLFFWGRRRR